MNIYLYLGIKSIQLSSTCKLVWSGIQDIFVSLNDFILNADWERMICIFKHSSLPELYIYMHVADEPNFRTQGAPFSAKKLES